MATILAARYPHEPGCHTRHCRNEEDEFRHHQYPIATHVRLNCLDESTHPSIYFIRGTRLTPNGRVGLAGPQIVKP